MTDDAETQTGQVLSPALSDLKTLLHETMNGNSGDPALLARQAELLDRLFAVLLEEKVLARLDSAYSAATQDWLRFALQVQKQCMETVKSRGALDYMQSLSVPRSLPHTPASPHPAKDAERTGEAENA